MKDYVKNSMELEGNENFLLSLCRNDKNSVVTWHLC